MLSWLFAEAMQIPNPKTRLLTKEGVDEQIRNYIALLTRQLKELTRLIQGMSTADGQIFPQGQVSVLVSAQ